MERRFYPRLVAEDAALYPDFLGDVTAADLRLRFFAPIREVNHELLDKLIHYDPAAPCLHRVDERSRKMLGWCACTTTQAVKAPNLPFWCAHAQSHGVGWLLMKQ